MKQITILTEDRPGILAEVSEALAAEGVNIDSVSGEAVGSTTVILLTVDRYDDAMRILSAAGYHPISENAIVVQVEDRPGELARVTRRFKDANINLRSVRIIRRSTGQSFIAISTERTEEAMALVKDIMVS